MSGFAVITATENLSHGAAMYREARDRRRHSRRHKGAGIAASTSSYQGGCRRRGRRCQAGQEERLAHSHTQTNTQTHTQTPRRKSVNINFKYLMQLLGLV